MCLTDVDESNPEKAENCLLSDEEFSQMLMPFLQILRILIPWDFKVRNSEFSISPLSTRCRENYFEEES